MAARCREERFFGRAEASVRRGPVGGTAHDPRGHRARSIARLHGAVAAGAAAARPAAGRVR